MKEKEKGREVERESAEESEKINDHMERSRDSY